jgi:thiosulfate reductase cytochrome b subunit
LNHGARTTRALSALSQTIAQRAFHTVNNEVFLNHATIHPVWVRAFHWINAAAVILMCMSGWEVYEASPIFGTIRFPAAITLGGWLGGALLWHFAIMWVLVANFVAYLALGVFTGRLRRTIFPITFRAIATDLVAALRGKLSHSDLGAYNAVQKLAYLVVIVDIALVIVSGLTIWKPVQFPVLRTLMGGFDNARIVHFVAMSVLVGFFAIHVAMVALVPRSLLTVIRGR